MKRRISVSFVLPVFVLSLIGVSDPASAVQIKGGIDQRDIIPIKWEKVIGAEDVPVTSEKPTYTESTALGYFMAGNFQVGTTYLDYQSNGSQRHQIAVGTGSCTKVHNVWTCLPGPNTTNRTVKYTAYTIGGAVPAAVDASDPAGGYASLDVDGNGWAVPAWHIAVNGPQTSADASCGGGAFNPWTFPAPNCSNTITGAFGAEGKYIWPSHCVDQNAGLSFVHLLGTETPDASEGSGAVQSIVYYKSNTGITASAATCGVFIDSVYNIAGVVVQDPASNKVAIVYCKPRVYGADANQYNNDVVYYESSNLGNAGSWGPRINVTNYVTADMERAYTEVSAIYMDGVLHIIWTAPNFDDAAGTISVQQAKLYHWDSNAQCKSLLVNADNVQNCLPGAWGRNINKIGLSQCTVGGIKKLYATYTYFRGDADGVASGDFGPEDCSAAGFANGEVYAQVSETAGLTWGAPTNLTSTASPLCVKGACNSEHWTSPAMYVNDSLRIQYILDKDAGGIVQTEGGWTNNLVLNLVHPCFAMSAFRSLTATPSGFAYPELHTFPGTNTSVTFDVENSGSATANYNRTVNYVSGPSTGWLTFSTPVSSAVPVGCLNKQTIIMTATGSSTQGQSLALVTFTYEGGATLIVPVQLWNFSEWLLPQYVPIRTNDNKTNVQQTSRIRDDELKSLRVIVPFRNGTERERRKGGDDDGTIGTALTYFADTSSYLFDGSLVIGNAINNMSWQIYEGSGGPGPSVTNSYGYLYAKSVTNYDSTTFPSYRIASGIGVNKDSTLLFEVKWYAPKHPDSAEFYVAHFDITTGPAATGTVSNVTIAYAVDWDIPTDTTDNFSNSGGFDEDLQLVYQQGLWTAPNTNRFGGIAAIKDDNTRIDGGFVWENSISVYPVNGYENDTLWNKLQNQVGYSTTDSTVDLNSVLVIDKGVSIAIGSHYKFSVIFASQYKVGGNLDALKAAVTKAKRFICKHVVNQTAVFCCNKCGDADNNGFISISDAVALINYVFIGVPVPQNCDFYPSGVGKGDFNGDGFISISDAVACISFVFNGAPCPKCQGMDCWTTK